MNAPTDVPKPEAPTQEPQEDLGHRPVEPFAVARQSAVRALERALVENHLFTAGGAAAIAQAVADPAAVRRQLQTPDEVKVFGGTLLTVSSRISALALVVHVTNGRVIGSTPYPASDPSAGGTAKFWPERDLTTNPAGSNELLLRGGTRARVVEALDLADVELAAQNSWEESIRSNGVFAPITVAAMEVATVDGEDPGTVLTAVDGSSRVASCHRILGVSPSDPLYGVLATPRVARGRLQELMGVLTRSRQDVSVEEVERARAATLPATIVVGFRPDRQGGAGLVEALDEYVALLHLEPPTPWAVPARENKIADSVIDALRDVGEIDDKRAAWCAGMLSPGDGVAAGFTAHGDERAAEILRLLSAPSWSPAGKAVSTGIRRLSLQQRASRTPKAQAAASLALRSYATANINRRRVATTGLQRAWLLEEFWNDAWEVINRDPDDILEAALAEFDNAERLGRRPSTLELGALAAYFLTVHGALGAEEPGSEAGTGQDRRPADKREPRRVLAAMMASEHGLHALHRAVIDGRTGNPPAQVEEDGSVALTYNGDPVGPMTNFWIRSTFRVRPTSVNKGGGSDPRPTPLQKLNAAFGRLKLGVDAVEETIREVEAIEAPDGSSLVAEEGMDPVMANELRSKLFDAMDKLSAYRAAWERRHPRPTEPEPTDGDVEAARERV